MSSPSGSLEDTARSTSGSASPPGYVERSLEALPCPPQSSHTTPASPVATWKTDDVLSIITASRTASRRQLTDVVASPVHHLLVCAQRVIMKGVEALELEPDVCRRVEISVRDAVWRVAQEEAFGAWVGTCACMASQEPCEHEEHFVLTDAVC